MRDRQRFVVEVKSGARRSATSDTTRRQLLEYALVYPDLDGLLLIDAREGRIQEIAFDWFE